MNKVVNFAAIALCASAVTAHAVCPDGVKHVPATRTELANVVATEKLWHKVFVNYDLLANMAAQDFENYCVSDGFTLPDVAPETPLGCEADGIVMRVRWLKKLTLLVSKQVALFCAVGAEVYGRGNLLDVGDVNSEYAAQMCLPTGPEGTMQTETVHIDDVYYWQQAGGTTGGCNGGLPVPPPY